MSFIIRDAENIGYKPGYFLASADCTRETCTVAQNHSQVKTAPNGDKYVPMGALISGKGVLYEDVDVTSGDMPGSVVTRGIVYKDRLPSDTSLTGLSGLTVIESAPAITRPDFTASTADDDEEESSSENSGEGNGT